MLRARRMTRDDATTSVKKTTLALATGLGIAALIVAVAAAPAEARKKPRSSQRVEAALPDPADGEPMTLVVSLSRQTVDVYRGTTHITSSRVSTGMRGYATKAGVFSILEKRRHHHSNLYSGAPMPWMQRLTWSGTALHGGVVPGYPASHGCVRLPFSFAPKLFGITTVGEHVVVARDAVTPQPIEHVALFQPLPPAPPSVVKQESEPKRESSNKVAPRPAATPLPVVLARADVSGVASDVTPSIGGPAPSEDDTDHAAIEPAKQPASGDAPPVEDTRSHAIDPFAPSAKPSTDHAIMTPEDGVVTDHAETEREPSEAPKAQAESTPAPKPASLISAPIAASSETTQSIGASQKAPAPVEAVAAQPAPAKVEAPAAPAASEKPAAAEAKPEEAKPEAANAAEGTPAAAAPATPTAETASPAKPASSETAPTDTAKAQETASALASPAPAATPAAPEVAPAATPEAAKIIPAVAVVPATAQEPSAPAISDTPPSLAALSLGAGTKAAAIEAAEPRSTAPLRILVTRRTKTDQIIGVQHVLSELGHLEPQKFDGTLGRPTVVAIKAFQKANGLPETGAFSDELAKKVYEVAGKGEPPAGHLFVRQEFGRVFDAPVSFKDPEKPLGTHLFTALKFAPGDTKARWIAISLQGDDPAEALSRLEIPKEVRRNISERLTPGSSLIIGDVAINSANLPKGADFLVWAKDMPAKVTAASYGPEAAPQPRKKKRVVRAPRRQQDFTFRYAPRAYQPRGFQRDYPRWPF